MSEPVVICPVCGRTVAADAYCEGCGAALDSGDATRRHAFAAEPTRSVMRLHVVSTLLPHLPRKRHGPFRLALGGAAVALAVFGGLRLAGPGLALAAVAMPAVYLVYIYEVEVYEDMPLLLAGVFAASALLGGLAARETGSVLSRLLLRNTAQGVDVGRLGTAALLELLVGVAAAVPAAVTVLRSRFDEVLDGFTLGVLGALGASAGATVVNLWPEMQLGLVYRGRWLPGALRLVTQGLFAPIALAGAVGLVVATLLLRQGRTSVRRPRLVGPVFSAGLLIVVLVVTAAADTAGLRIASTTAVHAVLAVVVLVVARLALHAMLLAEVVEVTPGPEVTCPGCGTRRPQMPFCSRCGMAARAQPKTGPLRYGRTTR